MRRILKILTSSACLLFCGVLAIQSANAQKRYPSVDDAWDATDYRALVERVERDGLELPTLSGEATKPVFERMVNADNIPFRMGQNTKLSITVRYQKLEPILQPLQQLVVLYSNEAEKGKPYGKEIAKLLVYETKAAAALLEINEPYLETFKEDKRYRTHVALMDEMKASARQLYSELVKRMTETSFYSKSDILDMTRGALNSLSSYHTIFTAQDRQDLTKTLKQQIAAASDGEIKKALTELHDAIEHGRMPT